MLEPVKRVFRKCIAKLVCLIWGHHYAEHFVKVEEGFQARIECMTCHKPATGWIERDDVPTKVERGRITDV